MEKKHTAELVQNEELPQKNVPFFGSTKEFLPGTTTVTGSFPNRKERRAAEKKAKKK